MALVLVEYTEEEPEIYTVPLSFATGSRAEQVRQQSRDSILTNIQIGEESGRGIIYDAAIDKDFCEALLEMVLRKKELPGVHGDFIASTARVSYESRDFSESDVEVSAIRAEQTNSSIVYGDRLILKLFRQIEEGINPDIEVGRFLTEHLRFEKCPAVVGQIEYRSHDRRRFALGILQDFVPNEGDAWRHALDALSQYFDRAITRQPEAPTVSVPPKAYVDLLCDDAAPPPEIEIIGPYYESVKILGRRTAELHVALASDSEEQAFAPEPFTVLYQRSLYQSLRNHAGQMFLLLRKRLKALPGTVIDDALRVVDRESEVFKRFRSVISRKIVAKRTRIHGDYHLGQVLYTGKDYVIIDFEGEPARPLTERRIKRSPARDIAGMLRSFHYAAYTSLFGHLGSAVVRPEDLTALEPWVRLWTIWIGSAFLKSYLEYAMPGGFLPTNRDDFKILLNVYLLEKALYELGYELNNRPDWVRIPLVGIQELLEEPQR
jgi:maltose alpha-D-glucosyltransferase/alpha-amylase